MLMLVYLYIPVYAGLLYQLRGRGYGAVIKGMVIQILTAGFVYYLSDILHAALVVYLIQMVLMVLAVCRGWFQVNKRDAVIVIVTVLVIIPLAVCLIVLVTSPRRQSISDYTECSRGFIPRRILMAPDIPMCGYVRGYRRQN